MREPRCEVLSAGVTRNRGKWVCWVRVRQGGKTVRTSRSTGVPVVGAEGGRKRAEAFMVKWVSEIREAEEARRLRGEDTTVREALGWFLSNMDLLDVTPSTKKGYAHHSKMILADGFADLTLGELDEDPTLFRELYARLRDEGYAETSVKHAHSMLRMAFRAVQRARLVDFNPIDGVKAPRVRKRPPNALSSEESARLLATLAQMPPSQFSFSCACAVLTGMRRGEICGLRWCDVDLGRREVRVSHALALGENGSYELARPKTESSIRTIPVATTLEAMLRNLLSLEQRARASAGLEWDERLYVFGDPVRAAPYNPTKLSARWPLFARMLSLTGTQGEVPKFHDLRHTFATTAIASGMDVKSLSSILGHSSAAMTLDVYADALASAKRGAMDDMDAKMREEAAKSSVQKNLVPRGMRVGNGML